MIKGQIALLLFISTTSLTILLANGVGGLNFVVVLPVPALR
jgi:hypothetical protein